MKPRDNAVQIFQSLWNLQKGDPTTLTNRCVRDTVQCGSILPGFEGDLAYHRPDMLRFPGNYIMDSAYNQSEVFH